MTAPNKNFVSGSGRWWDAQQIRVSHHTNIASATAYEDSPHVKLCVGELVNPQAALPMVELCLSFEEATRLANMLRDAIRLGRELHQGVDRGD